MPDVRHVDPDGTPIATLLLLHHDTSRLSVDHGRVHAGILHDRSNDVAADSLAASVHSHATLRYRRSREEIPS